MHVLADKQTWHNILYLNLDLIAVSSSESYFRENFIFANSIKRHICHVNNSQLGHDIPISVNNRMILPFREGLNFMKLRIYEFQENKTLTKISKFTEL